ncbi:hypothetical protein, partial [Cyclobacterium sp.]|uniref:hypothetical protein n=1 Tax=Cyclobacterium sp. TaxID=1966343 RepID=UPI0025C18E02
MIDFNPREMNFGNVDRFYIKKSIFQFLITNAVYLKGNLLDIGCGEMPYKQEIINNSEITEYTGLDIFDSLEYNKEV